MRPAAFATAASALALAASYVPTSSAASWTLKESISGNDYFSRFDWFNKTDPTQGLVVYQTQEAARAANLSYVTSNGRFVIRADTTPTALEGRRSVRIQSKDFYADGVYVLDVSHVPTGCAVWPAFWTVQNDDGEPWPEGGEIDIMENANDQFTSNLVSLHTANNCTIAPKISDMTGSVAYTNCYAYAAGQNQSGCRIEMNGTSTPTWGDAFNKAGGGFIAMERSLGSTGNGIRVWYWPRGSQPADLKSGGNTVDPSGWGQPGAHFPVSSCNRDFQNHRVILNIALGGTWPFATYQSSGCMAKWGPITDQVGKAGSSFQEAYWNVGALRLFTTGGDSDNAANSPYTGPANTADSPTGAANGSGGASVSSRSTAGTSAAGATLTAGAASLLIIASTALLVAVSL